MPDVLTRNRVEAIPGTPLPHGLLSASTLLTFDEATVERRQGFGVDWQPFGCITNATTGWCPPDADEREDKEFNRVSSESAPPITVYAGVECSAVGFPYDEAVIRAREALNLGEQTALEGWAWTELFAPGAVDVSGGLGDLSVVGRLAELESAMAAEYGAIGVIHAPTVLASYLSSAGIVAREGTRLRTLSGNLVAIGSGYPGTGPDGGEPPAGEVWMLGTSAVTVRQGQVHPTPQEGGSVLVATNDRRVLAERTSVVQHECNSFAVLVTKACCTSGLES